MMDISSYIIDIAALSLLAGFLHSSTALNKRRKKPFLIGIGLVIIIILSEIGTKFAGNGDSSFRNISIFFNILGFALTPIIPLVITLIFDRKILTTHRLFMIPALINIVATALSAQFGFIFYVDAGNQYMRGDYFFIFVTVYIINYLLLFITTLNVGKNYNYPLMKKLLGLSFFTIIGTSFQLVDTSECATWHCVTLSLLLYFLLMSEFDSSFDSLTGLYNRSIFDKSIKRLSGSNAVSTIMLDIDDLKIINDKYGHDYGDRIIKTVAAIIRESFDKRYTCYRFGGDEFAIIGKEADPAKIEIQLKAMKNALIKMREEGDIIPTVSYGYSISPAGEELDFYKMIKEADDQMYRFKMLHKSEIAQ